MDGDNPCLTCGACCAYYRVTFYWQESDETEFGTVPAGLTEDFNAFRKTMRGTDQNNPRCAALLGTIGESVRCSIYEKRASICREFSVSWENGVQNDLCDKARIFHGLSPLKPNPSQNPGSVPRAA